eukprot:symbB.v1.2.019518.t1/scaffold1597.1/size110265/1
MKAFVLIHDVATDSSQPLRASVPDNRFDTLMLVAVLVALVGFAFMRRIQQRRAAQRRAQRKARGTLLTALRIDSILNFQAAKAAKARPAAIAAGSSSESCGCVCFPVALFVSSKSVMKGGFVLIHDVATDSSHPFRASVPDNRFDTLMLVAVLVALVGYAFMRRIQQRRAAQRRAQRKARGTLLTALRIDSILNFRAAKAAKELALTPKERAMQKYAHTPRSTMYHLNRFSVGDRVLYI